MLTNNLNYADFEKPSFSKMTALPEFNTSTMSDYQLTAWRRNHESNGRLYIDSSRVRIEIRKAMSESKRDYLIAVEDCLRKPSEVWQLDNGQDRYTHNFLKFYSGGALSVEVSFAYNQHHRIESISFVQNVDGIRKGVLCG